MLRMAQVLERAEERTYRHFQLETGRKPMGHSLLFPKRICRRALVGKWMYNECSLPEQITVVFCMLDMRSLAIYLQVSRYVSGMDSYCPVTINIDLLS